MENIEQTSENKNYTAVNIGSLDNLAEHKFTHPISNRIVDGKAFIKDITKATGTEISFNVLSPKTELPYFHIHSQNEETYIILKGEGDFQVDDDCFPISEGSVIRVAPKGIRGMRNTSDEPMVYIVIQSKENSLQQYSFDDGNRVRYTRGWVSEP